MRINLKLNGVYAFIAIALLVSGSAFADRHGDEDRGEGRGHQQDEHGNRHRDSEHNRNADEHRYFNDNHRVAMQHYYGEQFRHGHCPRGLAKKHNGCVAPGHAHEWTLGQPLPHNVTYYDLPPAVVVQLGPPPPQHRYVRVASDILLIAIGTGIVADAMQDLGAR